MNIDGKNLILGRLGTFVAKKTLLGEAVNIFNCNEIIVTGSKNYTMYDYKRKQQQGTHTTGPYQPRVPYKFVKRAMRGMFPYKRERGKKALSILKCYDNIPEEFKNLKLETVQQAHIDNSLISRYMTVKEICHLLGGKVE